MSKNKLALSILPLALIALGFTACGANDTYETSEEPAAKTSRTSVPLQFQDDADPPNTFGLTADIHVYLEEGSGVCDENDNVLVGTESVVYTEAADLGALALEDGVVYCVLIDTNVTDGGVYYDSDETPGPDTLAEDAEIEGNPALLDFAESDLLTFVVNLLPAVFDETYDVATVSFTVNADCPNGCGENEVCGTLNSGESETDPACYTLCVNNDECEAADEDEPANDLCVRGPAINTAIDVEVGTEPDYAGVCAVL